MVNGVGVAPGQFDRSRVLGGEIESFQRLVHRWADQLPGVSQRWCRHAYYIGSPDDSLGMVTATLSWQRDRQHRQPSHIRRLTAKAGQFARGLRGALAVGSRHFELRALADSPMTVLGTAGIDFAAFHISHGVGWLVTGISLVVLEYLIAPED